MPNTEAFEAAAILDRIEDCPLLCLFLFEGQGLLIQVIYTGGVGKSKDSEHP